MSFFRTTLAAVAVALACAPSAQAVPVAPGGVAGLGGTTVGADPALAGTVLNDDLIAFDFPITQFTSVGGNVQNRVTRSTSLDTLIFGPRIRDVFNIATTNFQITAFRLDGYAGFSTDIDFRTDGLGDVGPTSVSRSVSGDLLTFRYGDPLDIGGLVGSLRENSLFPSILTDATAFALTGSMTIFGVNPLTGERYTTQITGLAVPIAPIPIPAGLGLMLLALGALAAARRRTG